jgi:hypothetical protein
MCSIGCPLALQPVFAFSGVVLVHRGKSLEAMLNFLAISGLFLAAACALRGSRLGPAAARIPVWAGKPVAPSGPVQCSLRFRRLAASSREEAQRQQPEVLAERGGLGLAASRPGNPAAGSGADRRVDYGHRD